MSRWFRHYAGMARDDKLVRIAIRTKQTIERVVWVWSAILESAAEKDDAGHYEIDCAEIAYFLRADEADIRAVVNALTDAAHVDTTTVVKWGDRQFISDRSAERQARYRERQKRELRGHNDKQALGDGMVTSPSRQRDAPETETETETDTEVKEEPNGSSKKRGCRIPVDFVPDQEWAIANGMSQPQAISEAANFCDYWTAKAGAAATKLDWPATWRTWVRNSVQRAPVARGSPAVQKRMTVADAAAQLHREMKIAEQRPDPDSGTDRPLAIGFYSEREH